VFLFLALFISSCGTTRVIRYKNRPSTAQNTVQVAPKKQAPANVKPAEKKVLTKNEQALQYIARYSKVAQDEMKEYKIPASITLAQGLLESGFGQGRLAVEGNNHFGIKCHKEWDGARIYHDDDEKGECFRVYEDPVSSFRDHSLFLTSRSRYADLFDLKPTNYKAWAKGLKKAGYATDPKYPDKLIGLIERFGLDAYDTTHKKKGQKRSPQLSENIETNRPTIHKVEKGDTLYSLSKKYNISVNALREANQLEAETIFLGQEIIIPKK
jgi:flagellum-specific peptidoglycan hydrolase FlgJ